MEMARRTSSTTNENDGSVSVLLNTGSGAFAAQRGTYAAIAPAAIATGDFNGDGKLDIVVTNTGSPGAGQSTISILLGDGMGGFAQAAGSPIAVGGDFPSSVVVGDFNGDGYLDFAASNETLGTIVICWASTVRESFTPAYGSPFGGPSLYLALGDFDNNGTLDMAVVTGSGAPTRSASCWGTGTAGSLPPRAHRSFPEITSAGSLQGISNGDGKADLAVTNCGELQGHPTAGRWNGRAYRSSGQPVWPGGRSAQSLRGDCSGLQPGWQAGPRDGEH